MRLSPSGYLPVRILAALALVVSIVANSPTGSNQAAAVDRPNFNIALNLALLNQLAEPVLDPLADPPGNFKAVKPGQFDPAKTYMVQGAWLNGLGCPNGFIANPNADFTAVASTSPFNDSACAIQDSSDQRNEGLILSKVGPTSNFAAAVAELINVKGMTLTELGYDIRKPGAGTHLGPQGSHCGAGAPRFNIITTADVFFLGCSSPSPTLETAGEGWIRLRWGGSTPLVAFSASTFLLVPVTGTVKRIVIVFDEGQDTGPDFFGGAILDNIDVNGTLVGRGAVQAN